MFSKTSLSLINFISILLISPSELKNVVNF